MAETGRAGPGRRAEVLRRLDREWEVLQEDRAAHEACRRWAAGTDAVDATDAAGTTGALEGCRTPADVLARVRRDPDAVLLLLLRHATRGDAVAARVVLQALLPKAVLMAAADREAPVDDYVAALWCAVVAYPVARRPSSVAANLALDTLKSVRRGRRPVPDLAVPPHLVVLAAERRPAQLVGSPRPAADPDARSVLARACAYGLVDPLTRDLLRSVYADGLAGEAAADRYGLTQGALRSRCSRALRVLARHRDLLAAAP